MYNIAIVTIAYNRIDSLQRLLQSLLEADYNKSKVDLIISIDKSDTDKVEKYADSFYWPNGDKFVRKHKENLGLRKHILSQGAAFEKYDALVILEDDIIVSPAFYNYVCQTVNKYFNNDSIAGISLYSFPLNCYTNDPFEPMKNEFDVYFMNIAQSWGQVWMKKQWMEFFTWYKNNMEFTPSTEIPPTLFRWSKSWLKYHDRYCIEKNKYFVYPYHALSTNCGDAGTHSNQNYNVFQAPMQTSIVYPLNLPDEENDAIRYDGFFQNKDLYKSLGLTEKECCLDLQGYRAVIPNKRFLLTTKILPYQILKSFAISFHPIEENVFRKVEGDGIRLYDINQTEGFQKVQSSFVTYSYRIASMMQIMKRYGLIKLMKDIIKRFTK